MTERASRAIRGLLFTLLFFGLEQFACADTTWILQSSSLTYHVSHPLHQVDGVSHAAKGKGVCQNGQCNFLIAAPVKSFDSGDSNRDLHMLQVTRGAQFPLIIVRAQFPENAITAGTIHADLEVQFAGQTEHYASPVALDSHISSYIQPAVTSPGSETRIRWLGDSQGVIRDFSKETR